MPGHDVDVVGENFPQIADEFRGAGQVAREIGGGYAFALVFRPTSVRNRKWHGTGFDEINDAIDPLLMSVARSGQPFLHVDAARELESELGFGRSGDQPVYDQLPAHELHKCACRRLRTTFH